MQFRTIPIVVGLLALALGLGVYVGMAAAPEPPGPPGSTLSYTLEDIYNRLSAGTTGTQRTFTEPSSGPGTGTMHTLDDVMGIAPAVDDAYGAAAADVASGKTFWGLMTSGWGLTTGTAAANPDPPCFDVTNRYVDCGNGTVHDTLTGLTWLKDADCFGRLDYVLANGAAAELEDGECGLTDGSSPGDWRLPTKEEWDATVAKAVEMACTNPSLTDAPGTHCASGKPQVFTDVQLSRYWSSTTYGNSPNSAWGQDLSDGNIDYGLKAWPLYVWPVRGGP